MSGGGEQQSAETGARPCGSCGATPTYIITLRGKPVPACLRHLNVWKTPAPDYTCPSLCVEVNHPGQEHREWLAPCPTCGGFGWTGARHDAGPWSGHYHCPCGAACYVDRAEGCSGARVASRPGEATTP